MGKVIIVVACFVFAGLVVNYSTNGRLFGELRGTPDPPSATHAVTNSPSTVRVHINGQVWTCRIAHGSSSDCVLTYSPSTHLRP